MGKLIVIFLIFSLFAGCESKVNEESLSLAEEQALISEKENKARDFIIKNSKYLSDKSDKVYIDFESYIKDVHVIHIFDANTYIFGDYCEDTLNIFKKCIENKLVEWDSNKDRLQLTIKTSNGVIMYNWETNDLTKGFFFDNYTRGIKGYKTIEELKNYNLDEEIEKKYYKYINN